MSDAERLSNLIFSCEDAAKQVLMSSVCVCVCPSPKLKFFQECIQNSFKMHSECSRMFQNVPECSRMFQNVPE